MRTLLIDGDTYVYRFAAAAAEHVDWGNGLWVSFANEHKAAYFMEQAIEELKTSLEATEVEVALSSSTCFRKDIDPSYKENRKNREPVLLYKALRVAMEKMFSTHMLARLEADDVLGILATTPTEKEVIIVSVDKDLSQIPGKHFNPGKPEKGIQEVSVWEGELFFYTQLLSGDASDNYPGCPRVGPVGAKSLLKGVTTHEACWEKIVHAYAKADIHDVSHILRQAHLARILRFGEYSSLEGPKLWTPPIPHPT